MKGLIDYEGELCDFEQTKWRCLVCGKPMYEVRYKKTNKKVMDLDMMCMNEACHFVGVGGEFSEYYVKDNMIIKKNTKIKGY